MGHPSGRGEADAEPGRRLGSRGGRNEQECQDEECERPATGASGHDRAAQRARGAPRQAARARSLVPSTSSARSRRAFAEGALKSGQCMATRSRVRSKPRSLLAVSRCTILGAMHHIGATRAPGSTTERYDPRTRVKRRTQKRARLVERALQLLHRRLSVLERGAPPLPGLDRLELPRERPRHTVVEDGLRHRPEDAVLLRDVLA